MIETVTKSPYHQIEIVPLPSILMVVDSGFRITARSPDLQTTGFSNFNFKGDMDKNFAALICHQMLTKQP